MPLTSEDIALRRTGLSSSDIVALSGTVKFKKARTAYDVFLDKCYPELVTPSEATEGMEMGHEHEPLIIARAARKLGVLVSYPHRTKQHPTAPWKMCTPDSLIVDLPDETYAPVAPGVTMPFAGDRVVGLMEAKLVGLHMAPYWDEAYEADEGVPEYVYVQVVWNLGTLGLTRAVVAAMLGTQIRTFDIQYGSGEQDLYEALSEIGEKFLVDHVRPKKAPPVDGSESSRHMLGTLYRKPNGIVLKADVDDEQTAVEYFTAKRARDDWDKALHHAQAKLMAKVGNHDGISGDGWTCAWHERASYDVEQYHVKTGRVFAMKEKKR